MIESREHYREINGYLADEMGIHPVQHAALYETIEALREVARRADEGWRAYELPDDVEQSLKNALAALPDWITENENP